MSAASSIEGRLAFLRPGTVEPIARSWDEERVFHDSDVFFEELERDFTLARASIDLEMYIFEDDACGRRVISALTAATQRGVKVRVLVDGIGSPRFSPRMLPGVDARIYHPVPWKRLHRIFRKLNKRNHRKVFVIDDSIAWVGSMNISACHLRAEKGEKAWRDTGVRVAGTEVRVMKAAFDAAWERRLRDRGGSVRAIGARLRAFWSARLVRLNLHAWLRQKNTVDLLRRIRSARERVWITTPYFVPTGFFLRALRLAARKGRDVRILLPKTSDVFFMAWANAAFYNDLLKSGVRIYEYRPRFLHSKIMIIDDWMTVGTSNINHRSFIHDLEIDVVLTKQESRQSIVDQFMLDLGESIEVKPGPRSIVGRIILALRYWM